MLRRWIPILACLAFPLLMGAEEPERNVPTVRNGALPRLGTREILLSRELWRTDPDDAPYFQSIRKVIRDPDTADFYVLDERARTLHVYGPRGRHLRSLNVEGEGPGQVSAVTDVQFLSGGQLGLLSPVGPSLVRITREGDPVYNPLAHVDFFADAGEIANCYRFEVCGDAYVMAGEQSFAGHSFLALYTDYGDRRRFLLDRPIHFRPYDRVFDDHDDFLLAYKPWIVASNQLVYFSPERTGDGVYSLEVVDRTGRTVRRIQRDFQRRRRTGQELAAVQAAHFHGPEALAGHAARGWTIVMPDSDPDVLGITEQGNGLWVETSRTRDRPGAWVFDVFDLDGRFVEQACVRCPGADNAKDELYVFAETVLLVKGQFDAVAGGFDAEQDPLQLFCYARHDSLRVVQ
jgi:hypothetical protein